ncbi:hypothetical protein THRCLA_04925 [Thraustotheca clavata]|uniref:Uncharacterized protein n=1 Tax=Thraustotheca clavata TaxID=74557 RepID=A0A1V9ZXJ9_9STRA|nr:hypothetical protein THRCLA_04925 [Thraustotheca clavata]
MDVIEFDAPSYYDLNDQDFEKAYVNNADGYFGEVELDVELWSNQGDVGVRQLSIESSRTESEEDEADNNSTGRSTRVKAVVPHSRKGLTKPASPRLQTARRAQSSPAHRKAYVPPDVDGIELAKQFQALPLPSTHAQPTIKPRVPIKKPTTPRLTPITDRFGGKIPPLSSPETPRRTQSALKSPARTKTRPHALSQENIDTRSARSSRSSSRSNVDQNTPPPNRPKLEKSKSATNVVPDPDPTFMYARPAPIEVIADLSTSRSQERAKKRQELELRRRQLIAEREAQRQAEEAKRAAEAIAWERELRLQQSFKAKPIRKPKDPFRIAPSARELTTPTSPRCRRKGP